MKGLKTLVDNTSVGSESWVESESEIEDGFDLHTDCIGVLADVAASAGTDAETDVRAGAGDVKAEEAY